MELKVFQLGLGKADDTDSEETEEEVLGNIKKVVVEKKNIIVKRMAFRSLKQKAEESVSDFFLRLSSQADICDFLQNALKDVTGSVLSKNRRS